ncbi:hypothetical protein L1987_81881 [Smallanthus sonchifolius]|uniref:Uncharacterized protein n=1 Tax=Smallanthus sonchifolius TaxID=185202 RepID=A0ACB8YRN3_9ASTR|nr:hypothetical protein L1987_81881 [Smallanthus sonchifolius]
MLRRVYTITGDVALLTARASTYCCYEYINQESMKLGRLALPNQQSFKLLIVGDGGTGMALIIRGQCAIIMFDLTDRLTYNNVSRWYESVGRDVNLHFVGSPSLAPPEGQIDKQTQQQ